MPATSETRPPKFAGPTVRQRNAVSVVESTVWAEAPASASNASAPAAERTRDGFMYPLWGQRVGWIVLQPRGERTWAWTLSRDKSFTTEEHGRSLSRVSACRPGG